MYTTHSILFSTLIYTSLIFARNCRFIRFLKITYFHINRSKPLIYKAFRALIFIKFGKSLKMPYFTQFLMIFKFSCPETLDFTRVAERMKSVFHWLLHLYHHMPCLPIIIIFIIINYNKALFFKGFYDFSYVSLPPQPLISPIFLNFSIFTSKFDQMKERFTWFLMTDCKYCTVS